MLRFVNTDITYPKSSELNMNFIKVPPFKRRASHPVPARIFDRIQCKLSTVQSRTHITVGDRI